MAQRVDVIVGLMQRDEWRYAVHSPKLAAEWSISLSSIKWLAAEASRRVAFLVQLAGDPEKLKADVTHVLLRSLHSAHDERARGDVARLGDIVTKITGARAPDQVNVKLTQYEALEPAALHARLQDQLVKINEALETLEAQHPELAAPPLPALPAGPEGAQGGVWEPYAAAALEHARRGREGQGLEQTAEVTVEERS